MAPEEFKFVCGIDIDCKKLKHHQGQIDTRSGRFINRARVKAIVGAVNPNFFTNVLQMLPNAVDFRDKCREYQNIYQKKEYIVHKREGGANKASQILEQKNTWQSNSDTSKVTCERGNKIPIETYLVNMFQGVLNKIDSSKPLEEQINYFIERIGFPVEAELVRRVFALAPDLKKFTYVSVFSGLKDKGSLSITIREMKTILINEFNIWVAMYPDLKKRYNNVSILSLLKLISRKIAK